jgi:hypothetical protein
MWGGLSSAARTLPPGSRPILLGILAAALVLRLALFAALPNLHQADEVYQVAEQAHRSVHGYGVVSWEFQTAARAAILPTLVKPIYALPLSAGAHQTLAAALFAALSLLPIWAAFHWAGRLYGLQGAVIAAVMMATWFELVYFAPRRRRMPSAAICFSPDCSWGVLAPLPGRSSSARCHLHSPSACAFRSRRPSGWRPWRSR